MPGPLSPSPIMWFQEKKDEIIRGYSDSPERPPWDRDYGSLELTFQESVVRGVILERDVGELHHGVEV